VTQRDPPDSPPQLQRGKRAPASPHASSAPPPPPGTRVPASAAFAAALAWDGDLGGESALRLTYLAAALQATGRLALHGERASYALWFRRGTVVHASSNDPRDDLGRFLVERGAVAAPALAAVEHERAEMGGDLVSLLAARGALNPAESFRFVQEHAGLVLAHALAVDAGHGFWEPNAEPPSSAFPLGSRLGLLSEAVRRLDALTVRRRLGARAHRSASRVGGRVAVGDLKLSALETRASGLFDGVRSVRELAEASPSEADVLHRVALLLAETELLAFGAERAPGNAARTETAPQTGTGTPQTGPVTGTKIGAATATGTATGAKTPPPSPATPVPVARSSAPSPASASAVPTQGARSVPAARFRASGAAGPQQPALSNGLDGAALRALAERLKGADHFKVLGVTRESPLATVKAAYFQLAKQVHPDAAPGEPPDVRQLRADVFARVSQAWNVLSDDAKRTRYLAELAEGAAVDIAAILEAEQVFVQATVLVKARKYPEALETLTRAIRLHPDEPEFRVWRSWAEFLVAPDRRTAHAPAAAAIEAALKKSPLCVPGYLFLAQMAKLVGDLAAAERHLKRGLAVQPEHADLERELKYLRR
jgi:hypothetical protein